MNSGELAGVAGVTVRALRHYHQLGILPEPPRGRNGYRRYDTQHLITVLRIRRLAALGVALDRIPELLNDSDGDVSQTLDELDSELSSQIDRLLAQRDLVSHLRRANAAPDLPPELARFLGAFAAASSSAWSAKMNHDLTILLAHLARPEGMPQLVEFYRRISQPELLRRATELTARFDALDVDSSERQLDELADDFVAAFGAAVSEFTAPVTEADGLSSAQLISDYSLAPLSGPQRRALDKLTSRIRGAIAEQGGPTSSSG